MEKAVDAKKKDFCMEKHKKAVDCKNGEVILVMWMAQCQNARCDIKLIIIFNDVRTVHFIF